MVSIFVACGLVLTACSTENKEENLIADAGSFDATTDLGGEDAGADVLTDSGSDSGPDTGPIQYGMPFQSCKGGLDCEGVSCCETTMIPGGGFTMGSADLPACGPAHQATVGSFALDSFEVSVGRFRKFVEAYDGTPPSADAAAHPLIAGSGWNSKWNSELPKSQADLRSMLKCEGGATWTDTAGLNENKPINCVKWFGALAFCAWDGGRLPTEAEWEYASAGGAEQRPYPWGRQAPDCSLGNSSECEGK